MRSLRPQFFEVRGSRQSKLQCYIWWCAQGEKVPSLNSLEMIGLIKDYSDSEQKRHWSLRNNNARQDRFHHERKTGCPVDCLKLYNALRHSLRASVSQTSLPHNLPCSLIYILPSIWTMSRSSSSSVSSGNVYSCYFVPGYRISRHVMFTNIHYYLGPCATVRPFSYQQREGYLVSNPGTPLTKVSKWQMTSSVF